jgi:hypothetical protein
MARGGRRKGAGRPMGSRDGPQVRRPVKVAEEYVERLKGMIHDAEAAEFFYTTPERRFEGNSLQFAQACVAAENLPVRTRLYAARLAIEHERQPVVDLINMF